MRFLIFFVISIVLFFSFFNLKKQPIEKIKDKNIPKIILVLSIIFFLVAISNCFVVIDAGEVGVQILFGKVQKTTLSAGINIVNPFVNIIKYPTRIQEYTMSLKSTEGAHSGNDSVTVRTLDGLAIGVDVTVWWKVDSSKANNIYENYAKNVADLRTKIIRPAIRTTIRDVAANFKMAALYTGERKKFTSNLKKQFKKVLDNKNVLVDRVLVRNINLPQSVEKAIQKKMEAKQEEEKMVYKQNIARKEAKIKEIEANGLAKAQKIINSTLTKNYLQHEAIKAYEKLANSENSTFILIPTSPDGTGMPIILDSTKSLSTGKQD